MRAYILAREDAIRHWRELMGPTKVFRARYTSPASIRAQFGLTDTRNTTHGSGREYVECHVFYIALAYKPQQSNHEAEAQLVIQLNIIL